MRTYWDKRRISQPLDLPNAGSTFKRPEGHFAGKLIEELVNRGVTVNILNFGIANNTPTGKLMLNIIFSFAQYERDMIWERTQEGKLAAKAKNPDYKEGRKALDIPAEFKTIQAAVKAGTQTVVLACEELGISRSTWYKWEKRCRA